MATVRYSSNRGKSGPAATDPIADIVVTDKIGNAQGFAANSTPRAGFVRGA